jgi:hypothetical protein
VSGIRPKRFVTELALSADEHRLAYVLSPWEEPQSGHQLLVRDLASSTDRLLLVEASSTRAELQCRGWTDAETLLVLRSRWTGQLAHVEILLVDTSGAINLVGTAEHSLPYTARFDPERGVLYMTRTEDGFPALYAFQVAKRRWQRLLKSDFPTSSFSGIEPTRQGTLIYSRHTKHRDLWLLRTGNPAD